MGEGPSTLPSSGIENECASHRRGLKAPGKIAPRAFTPSSSIERLADGSLRRKPVTR